MEDADRESDVEELVTERSCRAVIDEVIGPRIARAGAFDHAFCDVYSVENADLIFQIRVGQTDATADIKERKCFRIAEPSAGDVQQVVGLQFHEEVEILPDEVDRLLHLVFVCVLAAVEVDGHWERASSPARGADNAGLLRLRSRPEDRAGSSTSAGKPCLLRTM